MKDKGAVLLMSVIIIGAVSLAVTSTLLLAGIDNSLSSQEINQGSGATAISEACVEEALLALRNNPSVLGSFNVTIFDTTCTYIISSSSSAGGQARLIRATTTSDGNTKRTEVNLSQVSPSILITSWNNDAVF